LGHGNSSDLFIPQPIRALQGLRIKQIACGDSHCLAVTMEGEVQRFVVLDRFLSVSVLTFSYQLLLFLHQLSFFFLFSFMECIYENRQCKLIGPFSTASYRPHFFNFFFLSIYRKKGLREFDIDTEKSCSESAYLIFVTDSCYILIT